MADQLLPPSIENGLRHEVDKYHEEVDYEFSYHGLQDFYYRLHLLREWWSGEIRIVAGTQSYARIWCDLYDRDKDPNLKVILAGVKVKRDSGVPIDYFSITPII